MGKATEEASFSRLAEHTVWQHLKNGAPKLSLPATPREAALRGDACDTPPPILLLYKTIFLQKLSKVCVDTVHKGGG